MNPRDAHRVVENLAFYINYQQVNIRGSFCGAAGGHVLFAKHRTLVPEKCMDLPLYSPAVWGTGTVSKYCVWLWKCE